MKRTGYSDFASVLDTFIRSQIPPRLIDEPGWNRLLEGMSELPASVADAKFGFECDLSDAEAGADFSLAVLPDSPMARWLIERGNREETDASTAALANYFDELARPDSFLSGLFDSAIFEYDVASTLKEHGLPLPSLFLNLRRDGRVEHLNAGIVDAALAFATGGAPDPRRLHFLEGIWRVFPPNTRLS